MNPVPFHVSQPPDRAYTLAEENVWRRFTFSADHLTITFDDFFPALQPPENWVDDVDVQPMIWSEPIPHVVNQWYYWERFAYRFVPDAAGRITLYVHHVRFEPGTPAASG